jgi:hypothetical protein
VLTSTYQQRQPWDLGSDAPGVFANQLWSACKEPRRQRCASYRWDLAAPRASMVAAALSKSKPGTTEI